MFKLILRRVLVLIPLLLGVAAGAFFLARLAPGDFLAEMSLDPRISVETLARMREQYALDLPWHTQFVRWLGAAFRGDFGYSLSCHCPAGSLLYERIGNTAMLAVTALALALLIAVPPALLAATRRSSLADRALAVLSAMSLSTPSFLLALLAMALAARTGWFPIGGVHSLDGASLPLPLRLGDFLRHLILPSAVLALRSAPGFYRQLRAELIETLSQDYVLTARAKGLPERTVLLKHALRNAVNPLVTMVGNSLGALLSGALIVETVMSWPGLGSLTVQVLLGRDTNVLVACLVFAALMLAMANLLADVGLLLADPRAAGQTDVDKQGGVLA